MLEKLRLRAINWIEKSSEKSLHGSGIIFNASDSEIGEVADALLIDGALPSEINQIVLDMAKEKEKDRKKRNDRIVNIASDLILHRGASSPTDQPTDNLTSEALQERTQRDNLIKTQIGEFIDSVKLNGGGIGSIIGIVTEVTRSMSEIKPKAILNPQRPFKSVDLAGYIK